MSNIGIPTWVFQLQPWNSEAREPTSKYLGRWMNTFKDFATGPQLVRLVDFLLRYNRYFNHFQIK